MVCIHDPDSTIQNFVDLASSCSGSFGDFSDIIHYSRGGGNCAVELIYNELVKKIKKLIGMDFMRDMWHFLKERKKFWLTPVVLILPLLGFIIVIGGGSAIAPFIYTLF